MPARRKRRMRRGFGKGVSTLSREGVWVGTVVGLVWRGYLLFIAMLRITVAGALVRCRRCATVKGFAQRASRLRVCSCAILVVLDFLLLSLLFCCVGFGHFYVFLMDVYSDRGKRELSKRSVKI